MKFGIAFAVGVALFLILFALNVLTGAGTQFHIPLLFPASFTVIAVCLAAAKRRRRAA